MICVFDEWNLPGWFDFSVLANATWNQEQIKHDARHSICLATFVARTPHMESHQGLRP
jgi:hypothetical protein